MLFHNLSETIVLYTENKHNNENFSFSILDNISTYDVCFLITCCVVAMISDCRSKLVEGRKFELCLWLVFFFFFLSDPKLI